MTSPTGSNSVPEPVIFTFPESVFGRRLERYLNLRSLPYTPIRVPPNLPRPILHNSLSINHRRIPILALGRDIYIDTRLILQKLEILFPDSAAHPALGAKDGFSKGFEEMLEGWVIDAGPFWRTSGCIPEQAPLMKDETWVKDRFDGSGGAFTRDSLKQNRAWCLSQLRIFFSVIENMLSDGRKWLLGGERPGLAEIHGGWVYDWGINMARDMDISEKEKEEATADMKRVLNTREFGRTHEWIERFRNVCDDAKAANPGARMLGEGNEAEQEIVKRILGSQIVESQRLEFEEDDVLGLKKGQVVSIAPTDFGFTHSDKGELVELSKREVVIEVGVQGGKEGKLRLHFPRIDFKINPVKE